jgi:DNA-binding LytR/AlgR family response regulator
VWPALHIIGLAKNGREAVEIFHELKPDICFLDIHMPGLSGLDAAQEIGRQAHIVFVTAFDQYAIDAFEAGALDYIVKPVEEERLLSTIDRLQERIVSKTQAVNTRILIEQLNAKINRLEQEDYLSWIRVRIGARVQVVSVSDIDYFRSLEKYTELSWRDECGTVSSGLVRMTLKELSEKLDPSTFVQIHRSVIVNLASVAHVARGRNDTGRLHLKQRDDILPVSRANLSKFRSET